MLTTKTICADKKMIKITNIKDNTVKEINAIINKTISWSSKKVINKSNRIFRIQLDGVIVCNRSGKSTWNSIGAAKNAVHNLFQCNNIEPKELLEYLINNKRLVIKEYVIHPKTEPD